MIATDEAKHAELAYQITGWALAERPAEASAAVRQGFEAGLARYELSDGLARTELAEPWLAEHGLLDASKRRLVRVLAWRTDIYPAALELSGMTTPVER